MTRDGTTCPDCGTALDAAQAGAGRCPACLMKLALEVPPSEAEPGDAPLSATETFAPDSTVGPYRIVRVLGEGGMGVVYLAEQERPIRRRVALKVIKRGMESRRVLARFEAEQQALALMDHPAIAGVHDAGETADGRPYFVMEAIDGTPIHTYCDERQLGAPERLDLFAAVCDAVQHAHRKGVIHRDLKPSNILIAEEDGRPQPKIIDFGVAKAIEQPLTEGSLFTEMGILVGTPEYMSPEQADLSPLAVDTRSDVFSLGVILYELLTGALPFDRKELRDISFEEIRRRLREVRPSRPSARISQLGAAGADVARRRRLDRSTLARRLSGDLDLITMKALEKEPARRYESPAELAADIRRHLAGEPVLARSATPWYLLRTFVARHRAASTVAALFLVSLIGFGVWMSLLYRDSQRNLARALDAETEAATVSDFLVGVFQVADPGEARGEQTTARELLDQARRRIDSELLDQPRVRATLLQTLGKVYGSLGLYDDSLQLRRDALAMQPASASALGEVAEAHLLLGDFDEAETFAREALERLAPGTDADDDRASIEHVLARIRWQQGRQDEALDHAQRSHELIVALHGERHARTAGSWHMLANVYLAQSRFDEAEQAASTAAEIHSETQGEDHPSVFAARTNLAEVYRRQARLDEAERVLLEILEAERRIYGPDHPTVAVSHNNLGIICRHLGRLDEAVAHYREALRIREAALPANHPLLAWTWDNLGLALRNQRRYDEADAAFARARTIALEAVGPESPDYAVILNNSALMERDRGNLAKAEAMWLQAIDIHEKVLGPHHTRLADPLYSLAGVARMQGRRDEAEALYRRSLAITVDAHGPDHPDAIDTRGKLEELLAESP